MTTDLATRLEAAPEGSREMSDAVLEAAGWRLGPSSEPDKNPPVWMRGDGLDAWHAGTQPDPTRDLNAIVAMIEAAGWDHVSLLFGPPGGGWTAEAGDWLMCGKGGGVVSQFEIRRP